MSLQAVDSLINMIRTKPPGSYYRFARAITEEDWNATILPYIEQKAIQHKLLLQTMTVFTPELGAFFMKKIDTPAYRTELEGYYLYLTKGNVRGSIPPPTYKTQHLANELARNLKAMYGLQVMTQKVLSSDGTHKEYELKKCE